MNAVLLAEEGIYQLSDYIVQLQNDDLDVYINPYISISDINEISIREGFFNYLIMPYVDNVNTIGNLIYYHLPRPESNSRVVDLILFARIGNPELAHMIVKSIEDLGTKDSLYSKIRAPISSTQASEKLIDLMKRAGFQHELTLYDEFGKGVAVDWYVHSLER